jgi:hypothetical protein
MSTARATVPAAASSSSAGELTIEIQSGHVLPDADQGQLRALVAGRPHTGIFAAPAWLSGLFSDPPEGITPRLAVFREGQQLRGVAPLGIRHRLGLMHVTLLGGGAGSDRADVLAGRGFESRCADALLRWLREQSGRAGFVLQLRDVPHDSPLWGAISRSSVGHALVTREVHPAPYLDLHEFRSEACTRLSSSIQLAKSLERHRRWLEGRGRLRVEILRELPEVMSAYDTLVCFLHNRWDSQRPSALDDEARRRFHRHIIPLLLEQGLLRMMRVSVDLRTVAVFYGLAVDRWWGYYLAGYDRAWAKRIHLGRLTLGFAIDLAIQAGASEFDFLKGSEPVKYLWPVRERITLDADVFSSQSGPQLARATRATGELGAALAKSVRCLRSRS